MKGKFRTPNDEMSKFRSKVLTPPTTGTSKAEILTIPAMYHTEYNHIGTQWYLASVINYK